MTTNEINENCGHKSQLEELVDRVKEVQEKLCKVIEILQESVETDYPCNNNWAEYYDLEEEE